MISFDRQYKVRNYVKNETFTYLTWTGKTESDSSL